VFFVTFKLIVTLVTMVTLVKLVMKDKYYTTDIVLILVQMVIITITQFVKNVKMEPDVKPVLTQTNVILVQPT